MVTTTLSCDQIAQLPMRFRDGPSTIPTPSGARRSSAAATPDRSTSTPSTARSFLGAATLDAVNCVPQAAVCAADFDPSQSAALLGF